MAALDAFGSLESALDEVCGVLGDARGASAREGREIFARVVADLQRLLDG
jgi:creatinine amidohydrolase/Fe(II)-dependent formamide hydrolase-like protein